MRLALLALAACGARPHPPPAPTPYFTGDESGIREVLPDGTTVRTVTTTPTRLFRVLPTGDLVFVGRQERAIDPLEVRFVGRDGTRERVLARIEPTILCGPEVDYILGIQTEEDLWITEDGAVCLTLGEDLPERAELRQVHRIDPATGKARSVFLAAPPGCPPVSPRDPCR